MNGGVELLTIADLLQLAGNLTVVATLVIAVYLFMTGRILPKAVYDQLIKQSQEMTKQFMRELADMICDKVVAALKDVTEVKHHVR